MLGPRLYLLGPAYRIVCIYIMVSGILTTQNYIPNGLEPQMVMSAGRGGQPGSSTRVGKVYSVLPPSRY